jgi:hypothetical protein
VGRWVLLAHLKGDEELAHHDGEASLPDCGHHYVQDKRAIVLLSLLTIGAGFRVTTNYGLFLDQGR